MTSKLLTVFLLLALVALVVNAQNATNEIDECIKRENCAQNDRKCRAACAGVPSPDPQVAEATIECYEKCANDTLPQNENAYIECTKNCREDVYQEGVTEAGSPVPSKAQQNNGGDSEGGDNGESGANATDSSDDGNSSDGNDSEGNSTDSGASFSGKSAHVYVLAAVLACIAFTVGL